MMKKIAFILPLLAIALTSCSNNNSVIESKVFCFDTMVDSKLYEGNKENIKEVEKILNNISNITDNYENKSTNGVYTINHTNDDVEVSETLYKLLEKAFNVSSVGAAYFNPFCGSLSKKWKDALENQQTLSETVINEELEKINSSSLSFLNQNTVKRTGEAEIDLGGIAKGYALDEVYSYLKENQISKYLINAGSSSILLGEKNTKDGLFTVGLKDVKNAYIKTKNCFVSTSSISEQGVTINGVTYSHIINPQNGSAINVNDGVIVISENGAYGDAMSTSLMNNTIDEIKEIEKEFDIKTIVIKKNQVAYSNSSLEVLYH